MADLNYLFTQTTEERPRKRKSRFSDEETIAMINAVADRKHILLRLGNRNNSNEKTLAWCQVTDEVNMVSFTHREVADVRKKFQDLRSVVKLKASGAGKKHKKSGGAPSDPGDSVVEAAMLSLIQGLEGNSGSDEVSNQYFDYTEDNNEQQESFSATSLPSQLQGQTGPFQVKKETHCSTILDQLLKDEIFTDVTLTAEGRSIRAHRVVLCLASRYFRKVLSHDQIVQSVVILRDIKFAELKNIINFIYTGEATVDASKLDSFIKTAELLEISSLCEGHKSISIGGLISQSAKGTKRNCKESSPTQSKNRKISGEESSNSAPGPSGACVKDGNRMHKEDEPVSRDSFRHILDDSPRFESKSFPTAFGREDMDANEKESDRHIKGIEDSARFESRALSTAFDRGEKPAVAKDPHAAATWNPQMHGIMPPTAPKAFPSHGFYH